MIKWHTANTIYNAFLHSSTFCDVNEKIALEHIEKRRNKNRNEQKRQTKNNAHKSPDSILFIQNAYKMCVMAQNPDSNLKYNDA